jgi:hypothetical protein
VQGHLTADLEKRNEKEEVEAVTSTVKSLITQVKGGRNLQV